MIVLADEALMTDEIHDFHETADCMRRDRIIGWQEPGQLSDLLSAMRSCRTSLRVLKALLWAPASLPADGPKREAASAPRLISCSASSSAHHGTRSLPLVRLQATIAVLFFDNAPALP